MALFLGLGTGGVSPGWPDGPRPNGSAASPASSAPPAVWAATSRPLVMGATYDAATHSYTVGLILLCVTAVVALVFTIALDRRKPGSAA